MNRRLSLWAAGLLCITAIAACNNNQNTSSSSVGADTAAAVKAPDIVTEDISYPEDTTTAKGYVAYDKNKEGKRPIVLVVPEWWGLNDYTKSRAKQLAELGYLALAVDVYGNGRQAADPKEAGATAMPFYKNPQLAKSRIEAALAKAKTYPQADTGKTAAVGYCFGGGVLLNSVRLGSKFNGVVSFHGMLVGVPPAKGVVKSAILVCHGADDKFVSQQDVATFKKQLDSVGAPYTFKQYPGATHAFTNPASTEAGKKFNIPIAYNAEADKNSWNDMKAFFGEIFK